MRNVLWMMCCLSVLGVGACSESTSTEPDAGALVDQGIADSAPSATDSAVADGPAPLPDGAMADGPAQPPQEGLFVHGGSGEDQPDRGTLDAPFKTLQYAIDQAQPPTTLHVAAGTYNESITLRDQVSLLGGYSATDWADRDPLGWDDPAYRTAIIAVINIAVKAGEGVGQDTLIEGFYVEGGIQEHDHLSHGFFLFDGAALQIRRNKIHGGFGDEYSTGISTTSEAAPTIIENVILGGEAPTTYALRLGETTALVANNLLLAHAGTVESYGVAVNNAAPIIVNNTIDAGAAETAYGFFLFSAATPTILNNIVVAAGQQKSYGVFESTLASDASELRHNNFYGCATALYHDWGGAPTDITELADLHALSDTTASGNVAVDPGFSSSTDYHLLPSSPQEVREGGLDQTALGITTDMDRAPRTVPWSMGAYELDTP